MTHPTTHPYGLPTGAKVTHDVRGAGTLSEYLPNGWAWVVFPDGATEVCVANLTTTRKD